MMEAWLGVVIAVSAFGIACALVGIGYAIMDGFRSQTDAIHELTEVLRGEGEK